MGFRLKVAPGVRLRVSKRGVRTSLGPRAARVHVGGGRTGFSTGVGPVGFYGSSRRNWRRTGGTGRGSSSRTTSSGGELSTLFSRMFDGSGPNRDAAALEAWLSNRPFPLELPGRFTQTWFRENASSIHPGHVQTLMDELASRGWTREDIDRRAQPHLDRVAAERRAILGRLAEERREAARIKQSEAARRVKEAEIAASKEAKRAARWKWASTSPSRLWRRVRPTKQPQAPLRESEGTTSSETPLSVDDSQAGSERSGFLTDNPVRVDTKHKSRAEIHHDAIEERRSARAARRDALRRS